jgi:glycosyltransferase involved in cell wall biosynthesis
MKKIVFVIGQLGVGGGEKQLVLLLRHLDRSRFDAGVITFHPGAGDYWENPIQSLGVPLHAVSRRPNVALRLVEFFGLLRRIRPTIVVSWTLHLNFVAAVLGKLAGARFTIGSIRNDLFNPMKHARPLQRYFGTKAADLFVANSNRGREDMTQRLCIPPGKVVVIFNAVTSPDAEKIRQNREEIRRALRLPESAFLVVNVGRIEPSKNQSMLVRVVGKIADGAPDLHAVLVGEGPDRVRISELASSLGIGDRIHMTGLVPGAADMLRAFDLMCHTGRADGMPNVLLEAGISGLPIVSTRVNGSEDVVEHGASGYLVDYDDDSSFAAAVLELYRDPSLRRRFGERARERMGSDAFRPDGMAARFEAIFEGIA